MTTENQVETQDQAIVSLAAHYRPIGLKAVIAAAMMVKSKPVKKVA